MSRHLPSRARTFCWASATALATILAVGLPSAPTLTGAQAAPAAAPPPTPQALSWRACEGTAECATLTVPLDYIHPERGTVDLAVVRIRTADPATRRGDVVLNPGGPGVPGVDYALSAEWVLPSAVTGVYDIVGFDPRGVGRSDRMRCQTAAELRPWLRADATPDTAGEVRRLARLAREIGETCAERSGALLAHVSTRETARDLDLLRQALGEEQLTFVGASYGTYLGALYADAFPERVGRMVLDGVVDPTVTQVTLTEGQIDGFDAAAVRMVHDCLRRGHCPVPGTTVAAVTARINSLLAALDAATVPTTQGAPLRQQEAITALVSALYDRGSWRSTMRALAQAMKGNGTALALQGRGFLTSSAGFLGSFYAISCIDTPAAPSPDVIRTWAEREGSDHRVPEMARYLAWSVLPCTTWPAHVSPRQGAVHAIGSDPILLIGTTFDPATPYPWAQALARQLSSARLLTFVGDGHTAIGQGNRCVQRAVSAYLVRGALPPPRTRC